MTVLISYLTHLTNTAVGTLSSRVTQLFFFREQRQNSEVGSFFLQTSAELHIAGIISHAIENMMFKAERSFLFFLVLSCLARCTFGEQLL